ncbi:MAG: hypothetical protein BWY94_02417 [Actinobacteria bacterium ADurb.BinA094]|nr:MAG: hypothetical protein BWY94_02417 [Actinobacteria bacterium ADurb.BinA094]
MASTLMPPSSHASSTSAGTISLRQATVSESDGSRPPSPSASIWSRRRTGLAGSEAYSVQSWPR